MIKWEKMSIKELVKGKGSKEEAEDKSKTKRKEKEKKKNKEKKKKKKKKRKKKKKKKKKKKNSSYKRPCLNYSHRITQFYYFIDGQIQNPKVEICIY
jgi:hypothetical protein